MANTIVKDYSKFVQNQSYLHETAKFEGRHISKATDLPFRIASSPDFCPTTPSQCVETSEGVAYVYCTHTGGGAIHMDMYSGGTSGEYLGRIEDVGSLPSGCTNYLPVSQDHKQRAPQQDQPVECTGTCNFNYYAK